MKKISASIVCAVLIFCLFLCCPASSAQAAGSCLYHHGMELVELLSELTRSEEATGLYTADSSISQIIATFGKENYTEPAAVYAITSREADLEKALNFREDSSISPALKEFLMQRIFSSLVSQINGRSGVERLAASSICTAGNVFVCEEAEEATIYLYVFEGASPIAVTFIPGEDHAVSASATFIMVDDFSGDSPECIENYFEGVAVDVKKILPDT